VDARGFSRAAPHEKNQTSSGCAKSSSIAWPASCTSSSGEHAPDARALPSGVPRLALPRNSDSDAAWMDCRPRHGSVTSRPGSNRYPFARGCVTSRPVTGIGDRTSASVPLTCPTRAYTPPKSAPGLVRRTRVHGPYETRPGWAASAGGGHGEEGREGGAQGGDAGLGVSPRGHEAQLRRELMQLQNLQRAQAAADGLAPGAVKVIKRGSAVWFPLPNLRL